MIIIAYWIAGIVGLIYSAIMLVAVVKIWRIVEEIVSSGVIPVVSVKRAKKEARKIIRYGYSFNPKKLIELCQTLSESQNDLEATDLLHKLEELQKQQVT